MIKPNILLAATFWVSLLIETWLLILNYLPVDSLRIWTWVFFFVFSILATIYQNADKNVSNNNKPNHPQSPTSTV